MSDSVSGIKNQIFAIIPGSYDPMTLGHLDVVRRASSLFDRVYVAVMINSEKKYTFDIETRRKIAEATCLGLDNVIVVSDEGYLVHLAARLGCKVIVKGIRNIKDYEYEAEMAKFNHSLYPDAETMFLPCSKEYAEVSSTLVREALEKKNTKEAEKWLHPSALEIIADKFK